VSHPKTRSTSIHLEPHGDDHFRLLVDVTNDRLDAQLCEALAARLDECWSRLDDVVSELVALHEVAEDAIVKRARATSAMERAATAPPERA
jgi:hypothetical protein